MASFYHLNAIVTRNTYNLGSHNVVVEVDGASYTVLVNSYGERLEFTAPTLPVLMTVWNKHMAGVASCQDNQPSGFGIRVYQRNTDGSIGQPQLLGSFSLAAVYPAIPGAVLYEVYGATPPNTFHLGYNDGSLQGVPFERIVTGSSVHISSTSLTVARCLWIEFWEELGEHLASQRPAGVSEDHSVSVPGEHR